MTDHPASAPNSPPNSQTAPTTESGRACFPSLWKVVIIQAQNALNDKAAQYILLGMAGVITYLTPFQRETYRYLCALLLALPAIMFGPMAGWMCDRFAKRTILLWCSLAQFIGMVALSLAFYLDWFWAATFAFFFIALQATLLTPAKGGIVKELVGEENLTFANSWTQSTGLIAMVAGPALGGTLFKWFYKSHHDEPQMAAFWPMLYLTFAAAVPVFLSLRIRKTEVHATEKFRKSLFWEHFGNLGSVLKPRKLRLPTLGVAYFWFSGTMIALLLLQAATVILPAEKEAQAQLGGYLLVWVGIGIAVGSILVSYISVEKIELGLIPLGGLLMSCFCLTVGIPWIDLGGWAFEIIMFLIGVSSGVFLVPLNAYLQDLVAAETRGRQLAASSLVDSLAMLAAIIIQGLFSMLFKGEWGIRVQFIILGLMTFIASVYVVRIIPQNFFRYVVLSLVKIIYRVKIRDGEKFPREGGALLLANHVSYIDAFIISAACQRKVRFIASDQFHRMKFVGPFLRLFNVVPVSPTRAKDAIMTVCEAVVAGDLVCMFPEGQITRTGFMNEIRKGFELIARKSGHPVVPVYMDDLWGSIWSFERGRFIHKWPHHYAYQVSVTCGDQIPAEAATAATIRKAMRSLAASAIMSRGELRPRLEVAATASLAQHPWKLAWIGRNSISRGQVLAYSQLLAKSWTHTLQSQRVGVLASGRPAILANLALRLAGFTPVNIGMVELDELPAALLAHDIGTVLSDNMEVRLPGVQMVDLAAAIRDVDFLRLGMGIVGAYVLPKSLQSWLVRRRRRHERSDMEAVAWLRSGADNSISYHSLTHVELLAQSEQLRNVDSCREGETVCSPHGFASVEGTVLGLWNTILAGATLCASVRQATVIVTNRLAWEALCETNVGVRYPRAVFLCGGIGDLRPLSSIQTCPVHRCFVADELERFVTMSLPEPILPSKTAEPQVGSKPGAMGRLLPGYQVEELGNILTIICPDGKSITVPNGRLDSEDFLFIQ